MIGRMLGHYRIVEKLGSGGMGEVYRAEDTRLLRDVAIKVLPAAVANDPQQMQRLEREARALAALNHPNIGAIYGLEETAGLRALVLEFVPGRNLGERLAGGRLALEEAFSICRQIATGLEAAHERGVIHRDIKPANVMITPDGLAKVLDFGLAKPVLCGPPDSPTLPLTDLTTPGMISGTLSYMSPEQARGVKCDERTDIWAFGCVVYEALAGRPLFAAETTADTLLKILGKDADLSGLPDSIPQRIRQLIQRCVRRDPKQRLQHIGDARLELEDLQEGTSEILPAAAAAASHRRPGWAAFLLASITAALAGWALHATLAKPRPSSQTVQVHRLTDLVGLEETPAISPDGKSVAFVAEAGGKRQIWLRLLAGGTPLAITKDDVDHYGPRWSPDSASLIYYTSGTQPGEPGTIWEIPALGGTPQPLVSALGPADVSHDGKNLAFFRFKDSSIELAVASRDGSQTRAVAKPSGTLLYSPRWSPDDKRIAFLAEYGATDFGISLLVQNLSEAAPKQLLGRTHMIQGFAWTPSGERLIVSSAQGSTMAYPPSYNLWMVTIDAEASAQLTFGEVSYQSPDIGKDGKLVVSRVRTQSDLWKLPIEGEPADNAKRGIRITRQTGQVQTASVSPDETEIVFLSDSGGHANVWVARIADGAMRPITREFDPRVLVAVPFWSPRGDLIHFLSNRNTATADVTLWLVKPDGSDSRDLGIAGVWACWSGDGRWLYYSDMEKGVNRIRKVQIDGGQQVTVRNDSSVACAAAPDGSGLYYGKLMVHATGVYDYEIRVAKPESGPSKLLGTVSGSRVPTGAYNFQPYPSRDGKWLAMTLNDGSTSNLWALSTSDGTWRQLTDFRPKNVIIARRIGWSKDGKHLYAAVSEVDADIVMLSGLRPGF